MQAPEAAEIRAASERIRPEAKRTPVMTSRSLDQRARRRCFVKCENLQTSGSFKIRGAMNFVRSTPKADRARGFVAFSSGNHGQAVAVASEAHGVQATIIMPEDAPKSKLQATRDRGATVITYDRFKEDREAIGRHVSAETGATLVPPFDHPWTIAGQGTLALELLEEVPDLDSLIVCIGGGGMISGCSIVAKDMQPAIAVYGVEPELANDTFHSLQRGERVPVDASGTIADGLRSPMPGVLTFSIMQRNLAGVLLVSEDEIREAMRFAMARMKMVVEPSGAVCLAAALAGRLPPGSQRVGLVISGGNVDLDLIRTL
jgi:threonine dehydratase